MTPALWLIFALVGIGSIALIAIALLTAPRNDEDQR